MGWWTGLAVGWFVGSFLVPVALAIVCALLIMRHKTNHLE